jgi:hypothetical protein
MEGAQGCLLCRRPFKAPRRHFVPTCERCGVTLGHFKCYLRAVARAPRERAFFANRDPEDLSLDTILLCLGCRS